MEMSKTSDHGQECSYSCIYRGGDEADPTGVSKPVPPGIAANIEERNKVAKKLYHSIKEWQLRILTLRPGTDLPLRGYLRTAGFLETTGVVLVQNDERIDFEALSYTWGEPAFRYTVEIDRQVFPITANLYHALLHLRDPVKDRHLWIDQICINQMDKQDKSVQLSKMARTYQKAKQVLVWIGEHAQGSRRFLDCLNRLGPQVGDPERSSALSMQSQVERLIESGNVTVCKNHMPMVLLALQDLNSRSWYSRIWVKQEVWFARQLLVHCGDSAIPWKYFWLIVPLMSFLTNSAAGNAVREDLEKATCRLDDAFRGLPSSTETENERQHDPSDDFLPISSDGLTIDVLEILNLSTSARSSDPRDRIYGLLGMMNVRIRDSTTGSDQGIPVDYSKTAAEVYRDMAQYLILKRGLLLLYHSAKLSGSVEGDPLPSWVVDWRQQVDPCPWSKMGREIETLTKISPGQFSDPGHLELDGFCLGVVSAVEPTSTPSRSKRSPSFAALKNGSSSRGFEDLKLSARRAWLKTKRDYHLAIAIRASERSKRREAPFAIEDVIPPQSEIDRRFDRAGRALASEDMISGTARAAVQMQQAENLPNLRNQDEFFYNVRVLDSVSYKGKHLPAKRIFWKSADKYYSNWIVPDASSPGDQIIICECSSLPLVVRPAKDGKSFTYVGPSMIESWPDIMAQDECLLFSELRRWLTANGKRPDRKIFRLA